MSDFDQLVERRGTDSVKWDELAQKFGRADVIPMWVSDMDFPTYPAIQRALAERAQHPLYGYTLKPPDYAAAVLGWLKRRQGWEPDADALVHVNGVVRGLATAVACFTQPGDAVLVLSPTYHPFRAMTEHQGRRLVEVPLAWDGRRFVIDFDAVRQAVASSRVAAAILCSPHNPVGRVWERGELQQLGQLLLDHGVLVLSDEVHSDLIYPEYRHIPFASLSPEFAANSVTFMAASKTFGLAGLQTSVAIIPSPTWREPFAAMQDALGSGLVNTFGITATMAAFRDGDGWVDALMAYLATSRELMLEYFAEHIPAIRPVRPEGTYLAWLDCRGLSLADDALPRWFLDRAGVALTDGRDFGEQGRGFQRMNLAMPRPVLHEAFGKIAAAAQA